MRFAATFTTTATVTAPAPAPRKVVTHQTMLTGTGAISATVIHEGTNDETGAAGWTAIVTYTLSGSDSVSDSDVLEHTWSLVRARCTAISGTGATLRCVLDGD